MKWKINQMRPVNPNRPKGPTPLAGPVKPMSTPVKPPMPPKGTPVKPMLTPRGPRGTGPNDAPIRPKGPKKPLMPIKTPLAVDPGYAKGGSVKKGMAKGGMTKKGKC